MKTKVVALASPPALISLLLVVPAFLVLAVFRYYPVISALWHSLYQWDGFRVGRYIGLANYRELLADPLMGAATTNIVRYVVIRVVLNLVFPLLAAELVFHLGKGRGQSLYKGLFTVPLVVPLMVVLLVWKFIYNPNDGLLNRLLGLVGLGGAARDWLGGFDTALYAISGLGFPWVTGIGISGFAMLLYLAALQAIPGELYDAGAVDGIRGAQRLFALELPLIGRQLWLVALLTVINTLQSYVPVMVLTMGGPGSASLVPGLYLYLNAFSYDRFGYACAVGVLMAVVLAVLAWLYTRVSRLGEEAA
ncbi:MAG TPA: sugar ABC transporter permease [Spirochaetia bacterium]|nr:sugar ABC transporter permease [Spirochaetia bacterium]